MFFIFRRSVLQELLYTAVIHLLHEFLHLHNSFQRQVQIIQLGFEIAIDLGITSRWAKDRHKEALKAVDRILEQKCFVPLEPQ